MTPPAEKRTPLSRERVLRAAVALADDGGIESLSMRRLASELGVVPMALYKHVANKDELLDGVVDVVVGEIDPPGTGAGWKAAVRQRILSARSALQRHSWAAQVIESRSTPTSAVLAYLNSMIGLFREGGLSIDLTHHVMHAMGSRILGFSQELFTAAPAVEPPAPAAMAQLAGTFPYVAELARAAAHTEDSVVGAGCDDQFEFEFALDLLLDGIERLHRSGWMSAQ
ncbi:TetR/AcrR family transcriptional regulator [Actinoplanes auranticolor]|uniref:TetR family transcriptional regulator n=1 Tax=Actinoplanes auranticolor TaxID=47988 RepID=A0A919VMU2_9ACTN|nr:TetR/AcrR family transcriptional regulator [Actinoplanes auranticolor]GIM69351.1 TetR family transcriptional regulator [Actinoplanes auranticolor]